MAHPVPQAQYQLAIYDTSGNQQAVLIDWLNLTYTCTVNEPGDMTVQFALPSHVSVPLGTLTDLFPEDAIIEVKRRVVGLTDWYTDCVYLVRDVSYETSDRGDLAFTVQGVGPLDLLRRRTIAYPAGTKQTQKTAAAGVAIGAFVDENAGNLATTGNGRLANGQTTGITVSVTADGSAWEGARFQDNLLSVIQGISTDVGDVEFEVLTTVGSGAVAYAFEVVDRIGTDRSATVVFSKPRGNVGGLRYSLARKAAANRVFVLGPGEEQDRLTRVVNDATLQASSPWALAETRRDAVQQQTNRALDDEGRETLEAAKPFEEVAFTPIETATSRYGVHYFMGDTVTVVLDDGTTRTLRILSITVTSEGGTGAERIDFQVTVLR